MTLIFIQVLTLISDTDLDNDSDFHTNLDTDIDSKSEIFVMNQI